MRGLGHEITAGTVRIDSARLRTFRLNGSINSIGLVRIGHVHNGEIEVVNTCFLRIIAEFKLCPAAFGGDVGTGGHCCTVPHVEKRLGTGLRRRLGRADHGAEGRFREKSGVPTAELCGTAHVYRSAAREWLCVGKYGLRGVLWEGICDGGNRDGGRIIAGYYGELLFFQTTGE